MRYIYLMFLLFSVSCLHAQLNKTDELHLKLQKLDSTLFNAAFNTCDLSVLDNLISNRCEFFHDQSGYVPSKEGFLENIKGLCQMEYRPRRELIKESLETYPLNNFDGLYGAIQQGNHKFYAKYPGEEKEKLTSIAQFTHVWVLEGETWRLVKVLSFDHQAPKHD